MVGLGVAGALVFPFVSDVASSRLSRFTTHGPIEVNLRAGAERAIYRETGSSSVSTGISCEVVEIATAAAVPTIPASGVTLTVNEESLASISRFEVGPSGRYRVTCTSDSARPVRMAVGPHLHILGGVARIFAAAAVALVALCAAVAIAAVTAVKRNLSQVRST